MENDHSNKLVVLEFLKDYTRCSNPSQREQEEWYLAFPESLLLDPLSEFRLPFSKILFTSDVWTIVRPEINLKTYKFWFEAPPVLLKHMKKDDICVYAIKEVVRAQNY